MLEEGIEARFINKNKKLKQTGNIEIKKRFIKLIQKSTKKVCVNKIFTLLLSYMS